jgi:hypothetical protein
MNIDGSDIERRRSAFSMGVRCTESTLGYPLNIALGEGNTDTHRVGPPQLTASSRSRMRPPGTIPLALLGRWTETPLTLTWVLTGLRPEVFERVGAAQISGP